MDPRNGFLRIQRDEGYINMSCAHAVHDSGLTYIPELLKSPISIRSTSTCNDIGRMKGLVIQSNSKMRNITPEFKFFQQKLINIWI